MSTEAVRVQAGATRELLVAVQKALDMKLVAGFRITLQWFERDLTEMVAGQVEIDADTYHAIKDTLRGAKTETGHGLGAYPWCVDLIACLKNGGGSCPRSINCGE